MVNFTKQLFQWKIIQSDKKYLFTHKNTLKDAKLQNFIMVYVYKIFFCMDNTIFSGKGLKNGVFILFGTFAYTNILCLQVLEGVTFYTSLLHNVDLHLDIVTGLWYTHAPILALILILEVQRTIMSCKSWFGLWRMLEVSDWGLASWSWFGYGHWSFVVP